MGKAGQLQAQACWEEAAGGFKKLMRGASAALRLVAGDVTAADEAVKGHVISDVIEKMQEDAQAWVGFAMDRAGNGALLSSSSQPVEWYYVTHFESCTGFRSTTTAEAKVAGEALGVLLAAPSMMKRNPSLNPNSLVAWEQRLRDEGMNGLSPVIASIVEGWNQGAGVWGSRVVNIGRVPGGGFFQNLRDTKIKLKLGSDTGRETTAIGAGVTLVAAGAGTGFLLGGPWGAVVGGIVGALAAPFLQRS